MTWKTHSYLVNILYKATPSSWPYVGEIEGDAMRGSIILSGVYSGPYYYDRKQPYEDYVKKYNDNGFYREVDRRDAVSRWSKFRASILPIESVSVTCNQDLGVDYPAGTDLAPITYFSVASFKEFILNRYKGDEKTMYSVRADDKKAWSLLELYHPLFQFQIGAVPRNVEQPIRVSFVIKLVGQEAVKYEGEIRR